MTLAIFSELIELKAKAASIFPFILGMAYSWFHYQKINISYMVVFFIAMLLFNMAVDILDNYMDYHHATEDHDYKEKTNIIGRENLSLPLIKNMIVGLITVSALIGIWLAYQTTWLVLFLGIISYSVGIFYSAGPKPLSSLPVGEVASGLAMGYIIPLICVYLNIYDLKFSTLEVLTEVFIMTIPAVFYIANLMLANNICDLEEDVLNKRYTLVYYLGKNNSLKLFSALAYLPFIIISIAVVLKIIPVFVLAIWLIVPIVNKNVKTFVRKQNKIETFPLAIKNLVVMMISYALLFVIGNIL